MARVEFPKSVRETAAARSGVLVRFAAAYGNALESAAPTLLLLDGGMASLDETHLEAEAAFLLRREHRFQSVIVLPTRRDFPRPWTGWEFVRLTRGDGGVRIEQGGE